ncbi:MAG: HEAT repeat domain-containing protein [Euryarchaeota archaeon]|nr:HEAT repeat domain-containing protein [Euryarchaeota archaeon]
MGMYEWLGRLLDDEEEEKVEIQFPKGEKIDREFRSLKEVKKFIERSKFTGVVRAKTRIENIHLLYLRGALAGVAAFSRLGLYSTLGEKALKNLMDSSLIIESIERYTYDEAYSVLVSHRDVIADKKLYSRIISLCELIDSSPPATVGLLEMLVFSEGPVQRDLMKIISLSVFLSDFTEEDFSAALESLRRLDFVRERGGSYHIDQEHRALLRQVFINRARIDRAKELLRMDDTARQLCEMLAESGRASYNELKKLLGGEADSAIARLSSLGAVFRGIDSSGLPTVFIPPGLLEQLLAPDAGEEAMELDRGELMRRLNIREPTEEDIEKLVRSMLEDVEEAGDAEENEILAKSVAASALSRIDEEQAIKPIINALFDRDSIVRASAAKALGVMKSRRAVEHLIRALGDREGKVRASAARALGRIGDPRAIEPLIEALGDEDSTVRASAARALGNIGSQETVEPLIDAFHTEEDEAVRREIISALAGYRDDRVLDIMIASLRDRDPNVRRIAASALWKSGGERAIEPLIEALKDEESTVRYCAVSALDGVKDERIIEPLIQALRDEDEMVRTVAASALGKIEDERAIEALKEALNDESEWVRNCAAESLQNLGVSTPSQAPG